MPALGAGLTPDEALTRMKLPDGFSATVVAAEPLIRQPLSMEFDDRGRLWVLQYLQYPLSSLLTFSTPSASLRLWPSASVNLSETTG